MQVRLLIGRNAGEIVEMAYDRAVANLNLGHIELVAREDLRPRATVEALVTEAIAPRRRGRPPGPRRVGA